MRELSWEQTSRGTAKISRLDPKDFRLETTTVWSFPTRGRWATHGGSYPGNWAPEVPRNLILRYTEPNETVLDPMMGGGTTLLECLLTNRQGLGVDIEPEAANLAASNLNLGYRPIDWTPDRSPVHLFVGDARGLDAIPDGSVHLAALHPPYAGIIAYGPASSAFNLSRLSMNRFITAMREVALETFRVLAPGRHCAVLIGDTRRHKHYVPLSVRVLEQFLDVGFILREDIIKLQHKMKRTREKWRGADVRLPPDRARAPVRLPEAGGGRGPEGLSVQREVAVGSPRERRIPLDVAGAPDGVRDDFKGGRMHPNSEMRDYRKLAEDFATGLKSRYGSRIERILLFGSVARGEYREDSDVDLLVVTPEPNLALQWDVARDATDLLLREGVLASVLVVTAEQWEKARDTLFGRRVATEGLLLA